MRSLELYVVELGNTEINSLPNTYKYSKEKLPPENSTLFYIFDKLNLDALIVRQQSHYPPLDRNLKKKPQIFKPLSLDSTIYVHLHSGEFFHINGICTNQNQFSGFDLRSGQVKHFNKTDVTWMLSHSLLHCEFQNAPHKINGVTIVDMPPLDESTMEYLSNQLDIKDA